MDLQVDGNLPDGGVAVDVLLRVGEAAMHGHHLPDAGLQEALDIALPKPQVGNHRVLDQYGEVRPTHRIRDLLHLRGVHARPRPHPRGPDAVRRTQLQLASTHHLHTGGHPVHLLHLLQPRESLLPRTAETAGNTADFPDAGTVIVQTDTHKRRLFHQLRRCRQQLLTALRRARPRYPNPFHYSPVSDSVSVSSSISVK